MSFRNWCDVSGGRAFKAMLVYTDFPMPALHNNINLIVWVSDQERQGKMGVGAAFDDVGHLGHESWHNH